MSQTKNATPIEFFRKIWKQGDNLIISVPPELAKYYNLKGKYVKVHLEVIGDWK